MQLQENELFNNRYRLVGLLGTGGFSEVWLVEDSLVENKRMALKIYASAQGLDDDGVKTFSEEFALVYGLSHTNLLCASTFDICERRPYLIMPYCANGSANKLIKNISEPHVWKFIHDVSAGLAYLHKQNPPVIHQDIKPANVMLNDRGEYQIADFGVSKRIRNTLRKSVAAKPSMTGGGTLNYMGPERFGTNNMAVKASDVWALGATVFELITGDVPFGEHGGLIQKGGAEIPVITDEWSDDLKQVITLCLDKETWNRPSAEQLGQWAEQHFRGERVNFDRQDAASQNPAPKSEVIDSRKTARMNVENTTPDEDSKKIPPAGKKPVFNKVYSWIIIGIIVFITAAVSLKSTTLPYSKGPVIWNRISYVEIWPDIEVYCDITNEDKKRGGEFTLEVTLYSEGKSIYFTDSKYISPMQTVRLYQKKGIESGTFKEGTITKTEKVIAPKKEE
ncbi:MAG: serine/threonine-protein kinase [Tannerella sp.]|jgi:serine/threonine protein kinase|nr:serine/threonine-protein kinase [Tannerella sp.]